MTMQIIIASFRYIFCFLKEKYKKITQNVTYFAEKV